MTMVSEIAVSFFLGIASNLATDWVKRRLGSSDESPPARGAVGLVWSLPLMGVPLAVLFVTKYRWVVEPVVRVGLVATAFLGAYGVLRAVRRAWRVGGERAAMMSILPLSALLAVGLLLDDLLPKYVALDCPTTPVQSTMLISGRALTPETQVDLRYGPAGSFSHGPLHVPVEHEVWSARLVLTGKPGELWTISATSRKGATPPCTVTIQ